MTSTIYLHAAQGPRLTREMFERSQVSGKRARRLKGPALAARVSIRKVRLTRMHVSLQYGDSLVGRLPPAQRLTRRRDAIAYVEAKEHAAGIRKTLLGAARTARSLGYEVRSSKGRDGRISSYYCRIEAGAAIRISDHKIPETLQRADQARFHGRVDYDGYHGPELIVTRPRSTTWMRRALLLTAAGRSIP